MKKALLTLSSAIAGVGLAFAQTPGQINGGPLIQLLGLAQEILSRLVPFLITLAVIVFFWFLIQFIMKADSEDRSKYLKGMAASVLALFVMVSIWGIINFFGNLFGIGAGGSIPIPSVPRPQ